VIIPEISSYRPEEIQKVREFSLQFATYERLLSQGAPDLKSQLRKQRHQVWIQCVLAEYHQKASTRQICGFWSETADQILNQVCQHLAENLDVPIALFAYGKLGSHELNLSSDIDLVFISETESSKTMAFLRQFQNLIQEVTDFGFCFRNDFDLRPGGRMGPLVPTVEQFQDYYGNYGEAWERLAFVRLRPVWGNETVIQNVLNFTAKFTFRKHLDYTLLSDLQSLRQRIHSQYFHRSQENQIDLKLGVGGIRDLELFVHALQVVHGGRDLELRQRGTLDALQKLEEKKILPPGEIEFLKKHYWNLRHWENLVQAQADQQTHLLKQDFILPAPSEDLKNRMQQCDQLVSGLLGKVNLQTKTVPASEEDQILWLKDLGFDPNQISEIWKEMISNTALSRQKERDEGYRLRFLYLFVQELSKDPRHLTRSLSLLRDFLKATRAKATFYSLFLTEESLIPQMARIFSASPYLANLLCSRPELIDSFIYKTQQSLQSEDPQIFLDLLSERKLLSELINGTEFLQSLDLEHLTERMTETADLVATQLLQSVERETNCELHLLALGKWGGRELGLRSDLDFIFVTSEEPEEKHLKAARKFFHRLTESHHRGGSLYSIDLRLKPSGKGGLVVSSYAQILDYLENQADPWERQAYLRSRFFNSKFSERELIQRSFQRGLSPEDLKLLNEIRKALLKNASSSPSSLDLKYGAGGMVEIEFATQIAVLEKQIQTSGRTSDQMQALGWKDLQTLYGFLRLVEQAHQIVVLTSSSILDTESENFDSAASLLHETRAGLEKKLRSALHDSQQLLKRLDPRRAAE
jgi:glutamate-ammonia-ligase adenylyltransferase